MSRLISSLRTALGLNKTADFLLINQGSPPITRRASIAQVLLSTATSSGFVGPSPTNTLTKHISELQLASTVYVNDTIMVDQGLPQITRLATVAQLLAATGNTITPNTEIPTNRQNELMSVLPVASSVSNQDYVLVNQSRVKLGQSERPETRHLRVGDFIVPPAPDFIGTPRSGHPILSTQFTDLTVGGIPTAWAWTFGDGNTSALQNPVNNYTDVGVYTVSMTVTIQGTPYLVTKINYITVAACLTGPTWTATTINTSANFQTVVAGQGLFLAGGQRISDGVAMVAVSSDNGHTWGAPAVVSTFGGSGSGLGPYSVYGNGKFVMASSGPSKGVISSNGSTWADISFPVSGINSGVAFGNSVFIASTINNSSQINRSTDGASWSAINMPSASSWSVPAYGGGVWVAFSNASGVSARSLDNGLTWSAGGALAGSPGIILSGYTNGIFMGLDISGDIYISTDFGVTWTLRAGGTTPSAAWSCLLVNQGSFLLIDRFGTAVYVTQDGVNYAAAPNVHTTTGIDRWFGTGDNNGHYAAVDALGIGPAAWGIC